jgi:hypothetical protein
VFRRNSRREGFLATRRRNQVELELVHVFRWMIDGSGVFSLEAVDGSYYTWPSLWSGVRSLVVAVGVGGGVVEGNVYLNVCETRKNPNIGSQIQIILLLQIETFDLTNKLIQIFRMFNSNGFLVQTMIPRVEEIFEFPILRVVKNESESNVELKSVTLFTQDPSEEFLECEIGELIIHLPIDDPVIISTSLVVVDLIQISDDGILVSLVTFEPGWSTYRSIHTSRAVVHPSIPTTWCGTRCCLIVGFSTQPALHRLYRSTLNTTTSQTVIHVVTVWFVVMDMFMWEQV